MFLREGGIYMKKKIAALCAALCVMSLAAGCGKKEDVLDKNDPVTITVWNYYNGAQLDSFNELVEKFNSTVGKEKGIKVEAASQGSVDDLQKNVMDSINGIAGAEEMPNIFAAYADTAYEIDQMGKLANLRDYFTEDELNEYVSGYIEEGCFNGSSELKILPIAKSTEVLFLNATDWEKFSEASGAELSDLYTYEGVTATAQKYYEWTDSLTPEENDGKAFMGRDAMANYFVIGFRQHGKEIFEVGNDGSVKLNFDEDIVRKLWDNYYVPYVKGYFTLLGRFGSDDVKTGTTIAFIGSSSGASFFPKEVSLSDTETYPIESVIIPCPVFEGEEVSVQQGAGMAVTKASKREELASAEFLKWFTESEQNVEFSVESGYLPVKKAANDEEVINQYIDQADDTLKKTLKAGIETVSTRELYTSSAFAQGWDARQILTYSLSDRAREDGQEIEESLASGTSYEDALAPYLTDEYFENWYEETKAELEDCIK